MVLLFLCGVLSILAQVVLLRELLAAFYGVDLIYLLALGAWLLWTAVGALVGRRSLVPSVARVATVLLAVAAAIPLDLLATRRLRLLLGGVPGAFLPLPEQIAASALVILVPSALLGWFFQLAARRYLGDRSCLAGFRPPPSACLPPTAPRTLARAYAIESAGAMVAGIVTTCAVYWQVQNLELAFAGAGIAALGAFAVARRDATVLAAAACLVVVASGIGLVQSRGLDLWTAGWNHPGVLETIDTPYGRATITEQAGQVTLYENDALVFDSESTAAEELAHLSLLQHAAPRRVLLVEGSSAGLIDLVAEHGVGRIDTLEGDRPMVDLLTRRLPASAGSSLPRGLVHVVFGDPRRSVADCLALPCGDRYDAIVVAAAEPASAQGNRFFTREFFAQCAARLTPDGIVSLRLPSAENFWTPQIAARAAAIYRALADVFADVVVLPGSTNVVIAGPRRLTRDPALLSQRLADRGIKASLITPRYVRYLYSNDRYAEIERVLRRSTIANTDARPASYQATSLLWVSKFLPAAGQWDVKRVQQALGWQSPWPWLALLVVGVASSLGAHRRRSASVVVGLAAWAGMALESVLLVHYQLKRGVVFRDLGLLLMSVMAGLAIGAVVGERLHGRRPDYSEWWTRGVLVSFAAFSIAASWTMSSGYDAGLAVSSLALFTTGAVVAFVFGTAATVSTDDPRRLVSPLYAADVLGGAVGSIVASLVLIPLVGLPAAAQWAAAIAMVAALAAIGRP
ncbi:MAG: hypothetical protein ACM3NQ_08045 [Bacteroidales bacterium]